MDKVIEPLPIPTILPRSKEDEDSRDLVLFLLETNSEDDNH